MKNLFKSILLVAAVATTFTSCQTDGVTEQPYNGNGRLTLRAEKPALTGETRTEMIDGAPYWSAGDKIGVHVHEQPASNHKFTGDHAEATQTASFSGSQLDASATITAYYPYSALGVIELPEQGDRGFMVNLPAVQHPTATSFDGNADLLVSLPLTLDVQGQTLEELRFKRLGSILKVVLNDNTTGGIITGKQLASLSLDTDDTNYCFAGHVAIGLSSHGLIAPSGTHSTYVTAEYAPEASFAIGDAGAATYLGVYPHTLPNGSKLIVTASVDGYDIAREITLPGELPLPSGKITTLNISVGDADVTAKAGELRILTFEDEDYMGTPAKPDYWTSLVDTPQYGGPLLYGDYFTTDYAWYDDGNTLLGHEMPIVAEWGGQQCYWGGGQAISNYVEPDMSKGDYSTQLSVYCQDPVTGFGGRNGSKNFVVHYGYAEPGGYGMHDEMSLSYIYFTDYKARVIDHMYVTMTTYLIDCVFNGNSLTDPLGEEDWVRIVAIGLDENLEETAPRQYFELAGPNGIVADWQKWDLSPLGKVTMVFFNMTGSNDNGYGFSQPAYFAYDDVAVRWE